MLHIVNKSPYDRATLDAALKTGGGTILLIEDGVYAAARGGLAEAKIRAAQGSFRFYALSPDLAARGMTDQLIEGVTPVDYGGFVDLVTTHHTCQSWL